MRRAAAAILFAGALASCALFPGGAVRTVHVSGGRAAGLASAALALERVEADAGADSQRIARNAAYIAEILLGRRNRALDSPGEILAAHVALEESSYIRGFAPVTTVSARITLRDAKSGETAALILYGTDTRESLGSPAFLYRFLEKALGAVK